MSIANKVTHYFMHFRWEVGITKTPLENIMNGAPVKVEWIKHKYKDRWFADPFILKVTEHSIILLVEEYYDGIRRGRISRLSVNKETMELEDICTVLQLDSHLSFPFIIRREGKIFIMPENSVTGKLKVYEYDDENRACKYVNDVCEEPLTDAVLTTLVGEEKIFSTHTPIQNGNILKEYVRNGESFQFKKEYKLESNIARNAGDWFVYKDAIYRPAQDCNESYGGAIIIQKVETDDAGNLMFKNIRRIEKLSERYNKGCHTFNYLDGIGVVDVIGYRNRVKGLIGEKLVLPMRRSLSKIKSLFS